jgi:hypothetical protein
MAGEPSVVEEEAAPTMAGEPSVVEEEAAPTMAGEPPVVEEEAAPTMAGEVPVAEEAAVPAGEAEAPAVGPSEAVEEELACPVCGAHVLPDQRFCASCGAALQPVEAPGPEPVPAPAPVGPHLVVLASGAVIPLAPQPQLLVGRKDEISGIYPDVDTTPHGGDEGGVSRRHARLIHEGDEWYVMDLDSTNGTYLNDTEIAANVRVPIEDGDTLALGEVYLVFHPA